MDIKCSVHHWEIKPHISELKFHRVLKTHKGIFIINTGSKKLSITTIIITFVHFIFDVRKVCRNLYPYKNVYYLLTYKTNSKNETWMSATSKVTLLFL